MGPVRKPRLRGEVPFYDMAGTVTGTEIYLGKGGYIRRRMRIGQAL